MAGAHHTFLSHYVSLLLLSQQLSIWWLVWQEQSITIRPFYLNLSWFLDMGFPHFFQITFAMGKVKAKKDWPTKNNFENDFYSLLFFSLIFWLLPTVSSNPEFASRLSHLSIMALCLVVGAPFLSHIDSTLSIKIAIFGKTFATLYFEPKRIITIFKTLIDIKPTHSTLPMHQMSRFDTKQCALKINTSLKIGTSNFTRLWRADSRDPNFSPLYQLPHTIF